MGTDIDEEAQNIPTWAERRCENCAHWSPPHGVPTPISGECRWAVEDLLRPTLPTARCSNHETELEVDLRLQARYDEVVSKTAGLHLLMRDIINKARIKQLEAQLAELSNKKDGLVPHDGGPL